jgi:hypothetical protein
VRFLAGWWWWWWISTIAYMYVLMMAAAPHVHRQYGHVRPWRKSLGGVSLSPRGIRRICRFAGKRTAWISTTTTTTPLGNAPETYHRCFANVNGPQYYYCSSQIQPDDIDSCGLYCLYYFKRRHRGTRTQFYDLTVNIVYCHALQLSS